MKKLIISFALLSIGVVGGAQETFTQASFNQMLNEYKKDSKAFFINRLSDDFRYTDQQGTYQYKKVLLQVTHKR